MNALRCLAVVGVVAGLSGGVVESSAPAKHHTFHGKVVHVDHHHHKFTVRVAGQSGGKHHEHIFHVNSHTHFDFMGGKNNHPAKFSALKHGEHVVVHTYNGSQLASRVDIQHHTKQTTTSQQPNQNKQTAAAKPLNKGKQQFAAK